MYLIELVFNLLFFNCGKTKWLRAKAKNRITEIVVKERNNVKNVTCKSLGL